MKKIIILLLLAVNSIFSSQAATPQEMRFHCANDTTKISELLRRGYESGIKDANQLVAQYGEWLMGTPYVAHTLEGDKEMLTINIDELDCTTFVETLSTLSLAPPSPVVTRGATLHTTSKPFAIAAVTSTATPRVCTTSAIGLSKTPIAET